MAREKVLLATLLCLAALVGTAAAGRAGVARHADLSCSSVRLSVRPDVIDLFHDASIAVDGVSAGGVEVRLLGAIDRSGLAYAWTPYRWHRLLLRHGAWRGAIPAPPLFGIYQLQLRLDPGHRLLSHGCRLLRVFPRGTESRPSFATPVAVVRSYVAHLPGDETLVALERQRPAAFDHRDRRLHRLFVIAYAPRGDDRPGARLGMFVVTVREGFHGRWRLLEASIEPYD